MNVKQTIDAMAQNKLNVLHWHLVDAQSFPFDSPSANQAVKGAYAPNMVYSYDDIRETVELATSRGIRVEIEIDIPGHAASWGKGYPNVVANCPTKSANINNVPLNPALEETYDVVKAVLDDVHSVTPDAFTHLGGDEVRVFCLYVCLFLINFNMKMIMSAMLLYVDVLLYCYCLCGFWR